LFQRQFEVFQCFSIWINHSQAFPTAVKYQQFLFIAKLGICDGPIYSFAQKQ